MKINKIIISILFLMSSNIKSCQEESNDSNFKKEALEAFNKAIPVISLQEIIVGYCHNSWILSQQILKSGFSNNSNNLANCAVFTPCEKFIVIGYSDGSINVYDIIAANHKYILDSSNGGHDLAVLALAIEPKGKYLFSGSKDSSIKIMDMGEGKCINTLNSKYDGHKKDVDVFAVSPNGNWLVSGSKDSFVKIWDIKDISNIKCIESISCQLPRAFRIPCYPRSMAFSSDGNYFAFSILYKSNIIKRYPHLGDTRICKINQDSISSISKEGIIAYDLGFFYNQEQCLCWIDNRNLRFATPDNIKYGWHEDQVADQSEYGKIIDVSNQSKLICYLKSKDTIKIRHYLSHQFFEIYHGDIYALALSLNGQYLLVLSKEGVKLWQNQSFTLKSFQDNQLF